MTIPEDGNKATKKGKTIIIKYPYCNFRCKYCYEYQYGILGNRDRPILTDSEIASIVATISELSRKNNQEFLILLHGGEPLLIDDYYFGKIVQLIQRNNHLKLAIQTNLYSLSEYKVSALRNLYSFGERGIGISLDGPPEINDQLRITKEKKATTYQIVENIKKLREANIPFSILTVVSRINISYPEEIFNFIYSLQPEFWRLIPCFDMDNEGRLKNYAISPEEYCNFLFEIFKILIRKKKLSRFPVDPLISIALRILGKKVLFCEYSEEKCEQFLTINGNKQCFLCDAWYGNSAVFVGKWSPNYILSSLQPSSYKKIKEILLKDCQSCKYKNLCTGGCLARRWEFKLHSPSLYEEYCKSRIKLSLLIKEFLNATSNISSNINN